MKDPISSLDAAGIVISVDGVTAAQEVCGRKPLGLVVRLAAIALARSQPLRICQIRELAIEVTHHHQTSAKKAS